MIVLFNAFGLYILPVACRCTFDVVVNFVGIAVGFVCVLVASEVGGASDVLCLLLFCLTLPFAVCQEKMRNIDPTVVLVLTGNFLKYII